METIEPFKHLRRVYCAGPLFNAAERREMDQIAEQLQRDGFETFVPHADGMEFSKVRPILVQGGLEPETAGQLLHEVIFALDTYHVVLGCGSLVFNMNGRVPDEGAVAEATMAWMLGKPMIIFKEDVRSLITGRDNPLLLGQTRFESISEMPELGTALDAKIRELALDPRQSVSCPSHLERTLELGSRLWETIASLGQDHSDTQIAQTILDLFGPETYADGRLSAR